MKPGTHSLEKLLEHEMGHALGMGHADIPNHIMNPVLENMRLMYWDIYGLYCSLWLLPWCILLLLRSL